MFRPWGSVVIVLLALGLIAFRVRDARRRRRRGEQGWTGGHIVGLVAMVLVVASQVLLLV